MEFVSCEYEIPFSEWKVIKVMFQTNQKYPFLGAAKRICSGDLRVLQR